MTNTELSKIFQVTGKTARDFIRWAKNETGIVFSDAEVSDWKGEGKRPRRLTKAPKALFILFFKASCPDTLYENIKRFREKHGGGLGPDDLIGLKNSE